MDLSAFSIGTRRSGRSEPAGPATTPHASSGWSRRACAMIPSTMLRSMVSTRIAYPAALLDNEAAGGAVHADLVMTGGIVRAVAGPYADPTAPPTAVAIREGRILAVGHEEEIWGFVRPATDVIDLAGGSVLPGFQDAHAHPVSGGLERNRCDLTGDRTESACLATIGAYARANPDRLWIEGGGWSMETFPGGCPSATVLDGVVADRPVYLPNRDHHSAWVNSRALEIAGITRDTLDPADGRIERDADGHPTGALHEGAMNMVQKHLPETTTAELRRGLLVGQAYMHSLGITAWQDAWVGDGPSIGDSLDVYLDVAATGELTARVVGALWWAR